MNGISVGLFSRMPSIRVRAARVFIPEENVSIANKFFYTVNVSDGQIISPKFTFLENYPKARVSFGDQTPTMAVTSGIEVRHSYRVRGIYTVRLLSQSQDIYLRSVDIRDEPVVVSSSWPGLLEFKALERVIDIWAVRYGEVGVMKIAR